MHNLYMGRAGRPTGNSLPPELRELHEEGLPEGWGQYWHGEKRGVNDELKLEDLLQEAGYVQDGNIFGNVYEICLQPKLALEERQEFFDSLPESSFANEEFHKHLQRHPGLSEEEYGVGIYTENGKQHYNIHVGEELRVSGYVEPGTPTEEVLNRISNRIQELAAHERTDVLNALRIQEEIFQALHKEDKDYNDEITRAGIEWLEGRRLEEGSYEEFTDEEWHTSKLLAISPSAWKKTFSSDGRTTDWEVSYPGVATAYGRSNNLQAWEEAQREAEKQAQDYLEEFLEYIDF